MEDFVKYFRKKLLCILSTGLLISCHPPADTRLDYVNNCELPVFSRVIYGEYSQDSWLNDIKSFYEFRLDELSESLIKPNDSTTLIIRGNWEGELSISSRSIFVYSVDSISLYNFILRDDQNSIRNVQVTKMNINEIKRNNWNIYCERREE